MKKIVLGLVALLVIGGMVIGSSETKQKLAGDPPMDRPDSIRPELAYSEVLAGTNSIFASLRKA